ncbi:MAG: hypothetical protein N2322_05070, partial [Terrimicrobiaceae bacterium]|nr:hypothetical protein [Terrimicrobiaceae bacterium]
YGPLLKVFQEIFPEDEFLRGFSPELFEQRVQAMREAAAAEDPPPADRERGPPAAGWWGAAGGVQPLRPRRLPIAGESPRRMAAERAWASSPSASQKASMTGKDLASAARSY